MIDARMVDAVRRQEVNERKNLAPCRARFSSKVFATGSGLPRIALVLVALALSACVDRAMNDRAMTYNHQVEAAENDGMLLNVVRASLRHPLYFTGFSDIHSPASNSVGSVFTVPFGAAAAASSGVIASPTLQVSENVAQFGVGVINSSDFIRGISTPIGVQTVDLFRQRSFHTEHLLSLVIGRIETAEGRTYWNYPREDEARQFQNLLRLLIALGLTTETTKDPVNIGLPMKAEDVKTLDKLPTLSAPDIELVKASDGRYRVRKVRTVQRFCFSRPPILRDRDMPNASDDFIKRALAVTCKSWIDANVAEATDNELDTSEVLNQQAARYRSLPIPPRQRSVDDSLMAFVKQHLPDLPPRLVADNGTNTGNVDHAINLGLLSIFLRSPEAMILYLGDITAIQRHQNAAVGPRFLTNESYESIRSGECGLVAAGEHSSCNHVQEILLFRVKRDAPSGRDLATVEYMGSHYSVFSGNDEQGGRSSETLSVISTLLSLYRSVSDLPQAIPVRILPE